MTTNTLPTYDPKAACPVCGFDDVTVRYQGARLGTEPPDYALGNRAWMRRECQRCAYRWAEAPLSGRHRAPRTEVEHG